MCTSLLRFLRKQRACKEHSQAAAAAAAVLLGMSWVLNEIRYSKAIFARPLTLCTYCTYGGTRRTQRNPADFCMPL